MFKQALVKRVEWSLGAERFSAVLVVWAEDGKFRAVFASGEAEQPHDDSFREEVFESADEAFAWLESQL